MNFGTIVAWLAQNIGFVSQVITAIETIAQDLQNLHGNNSIDAYAKAILAAIESFFAGLGASTAPTTPEKSTISNTTAAIPTPDNLPSFTPQ
jgi:uncharacterized membrane protein